MPADPFDPAEHDRESRRLYMQYVAEHDRILQVYRAIWSDLNQSERDAMAAAAVAFDQAGKAVERISRSMVNAPYVFADPATASEVLGYGEVEGFPSMGVVAALKKPATIAPLELACAFACWSAGEEYVPSMPVSERHPRWPQTPEVVEFINNPFSPKADPDSE